jgi:hypothetical protein
MTKIGIYSRKKKSEHIRNQAKNVQMNLKQHVLGASKNGQTEKGEKRTEKTKQRNYTLLSSLLDFYSYIFAFGLRFLFQLFGVREI